MARVRHYVDKDTGEIIRETKSNGTFTRETVTQDQHDTHEAKQGCITGIASIIIFIWLAINYF